MKTREAVELFVTNRRLRGLSVRTIEQYRQQLSFFADAFQRLPVTPEDMEAFLASIDSTQETIHSYFRILRAFYNFLERRYGIVNPMHNVQAPKVNAKVMPTLEVSDIELLSIFTSNQRDNALIVLFLDTGIRASEATSLKRDNIKEDYILVEGKVGQRTVPISDFVRILLLSLPKYDDGYVFHGHKGKLTRSGAYFIVRRALQQIGIKGGKLGPHRLRHTFGRQYIMLGGDLRSLQIILGHANITTTQKYTALAMNDVISKHKKYSPAQLMGVK